MNPYLTGGDGRWIERCHTNQKPAPMVTVQKKVNNMYSEPSPVATNSEMLKTATLNAQRGFGTTVDYQTLNSSYGTFKRN
eukprot:6200085-Pleurochrysis_carterae.AAC.3